MSRLGFAKKYWRQTRIIGVEYNAAISLQKQIFGLQELGMFNNNKSPHSSKWGSQLKEPPQAKYIKLPMNLCQKNTNKKKLRFSWQCGSLFYRSSPPPGCASKQVHWPGHSHLVKVQRSHTHKMYISWTDSLRYLYITFTTLPLPGSLSISNEMNERKCRGVTS